MSAALKVPVPSLLSADTGEWVRAFTLRMRDEVAGPLFSGQTPREFEAALPEHLARGAALRFRWLAQLTEMPVDEAQVLVNEWLRPPPPSLLGELERRAVAMLGAERSFQIRRAFMLTFSDAIDGVSAVVDRWRRADGDASLRLVELARVAEAVAPQDVLALGWMMVLFGDAPSPRPEVADQAATTLLRLTADRLAAMHAVVRHEAPPVRQVAVDDRRLTNEWLRHHPALVGSLVTLMGLACDDPATAELQVSARPDPDAEDLSLAELRVGVRGDPDAALDRLECRALRAGALGVMGDTRGGVICLTTEAVEP